MLNFINWGALGNIVIFGLFVGAGLPAIFAVGVRALDGPGSRDQEGRRLPQRVALAVACLGAVVIALAVGIFTIARGGH